MFTYCQAVIGIVRSMSPNVDCEERMPTGLMRPYSSHYLWGATTQEEHRLQANGFATRHLPPAQASPVLETASKLEGGVRQKCDKDLKRVFTTRAIGKVHTLKQILDLSTSASLLSSYRW